MSKKRVAELRAEPPHARMPPMPSLTSRAAAATARFVAYVYNSLGLFAVVLGLGLLAKFWTLNEIGGGMFRAADPGFVMRLILPFVLGLQFAVTTCGLILVVLGGWHLAGGIGYLQRWKIGRILLVMLSGFYVVLLLVLTVVTLFENAPKAVPVAVFLGLHTLFFWLFLKAR